MAAWIKMPLGTEVNLGPSDVVLDGTQLSSLPQRGTAPIFGPYLLLPNGWMDQNATSYRKVGLDTGNIVLDGDPATPASATDS